MLCGLWLEQTGADLGPSTLQHCLELCHPLGPRPHPTLMSSTRATSQLLPRALLVQLVFYFSILIRESEEELTR